MVTPVSNNHHSYSYNHIMIYFPGRRTGTGYTPLQSLHLRDLHRQGAQCITHRRLGIVGYVRSSHSGRLPSGMLRGEQPMPHGLVLTVIGMFIHDGYGIMSFCII